MSLDRPAGLGVMHCVTRFQVRGAFMGRRFSGLLASGLVALACAGGVSPAMAIDEPVRRIVDLNQARAEPVVRVRTARVMLADYALIRRDFTEVRSMTDAQIDAWLLDKTAWIAEPQARQAEVNTPIDVMEGRGQAFRPASYGRALVFPAGDRGLIDAKGAGALAPEAGHHSNGLATLGEVIREFSYEKLARMLFLHGRTRFETVGHYGVIDLGFDVIHADGSRDPAGMVLRQAHRRYAGHYQSIFKGEHARNVERALRRYGVTTAGMHFRTSEIELINVQGTPEGAVVDFGAFLTVERFEHPARSLAEPGELLLEPGHINFVQPDSAVRIPVDVWGTTVSGILDPKYDNPWIWSHELARDLRRGVALREHAALHYDNLVGSVRRRLFGASSVEAMGAIGRILGSIH